MSARSQQPTFAAYTPEEFRRLHDLGWGSERLARHFGMGNLRAERIRNSMGLEPHQQRVTPEYAAKLDAALARYNEGGLSLPQAARLFGVGENSLKSWRRKARETKHRCQSEAQAAAVKAAIAMQERHKRLIRQWDRRREIAGGVPWDAGA